MGGRGGSSGINSISNRIYGLKVELEYAQMKAKEWANMPYGGTLESRRRFAMWNDEARRIQKELAELEKKKRKKNKSSNMPF